MSFEDAVISNAKNVEKVSRYISEVEAQGKSDLPSAKLSPIPADSCSVDFPIDVGLLPWLQVLAGHLVDFNSWGYITSYGLFQAYYTESLSRSPSNISWIGSVQIFLVFSLSAVSTYAIYTKHCRTVIAIGLGLQVLGVFMTAESSTYWQLFMSQGLCQGIGMGVAFPPTMALIWLYFKRYRALAGAGIASGTSTGGVVFPLIAREMMPVVGFKWTIRTMGFVILFNSMLIVLLVRPQPTTRKSKELIDKTAGKDTTFLLFGIGMILCVTGLFFGFYYAVPFAEDILHVSSKTSLLILLLLNAVGLLGRLIPAYVADKFLGSTNTLIIVAFASAILTFLWAVASSLPNFWAWTLMYGFFGASVQSLFPSGLANMTSDQDKTYVRVGMMFSFLSFGCLCGTPIAGALVKSFDGQYLVAQMVLGTVMTVGVLFLIASRISFSGRRFFVQC